MFSDGKSAQLSENILEREALFESSINGRETLFEEVKAPEIAGGSERAGILRNYRRNPPVELSEDQQLDLF
jgi:hypothetical protein